MPELAVPLEYALQSALRSTPNLLARNPETAKAML